MLLANSCEKTPNTRPQILVSIAPQEAFVKKIVGDFADIHILVPAGSNPHLYEPTPKQMVEAGHCIIWFRIGESFETRALPFLQERYPQLTIVDTRQGLSLIPCVGCQSGHHGGEDTHIWLSPRLVKKQAETMAKALYEKFPKRKKFFESNLIHFKKELTELDAWIDKLMAPLPLRTLLVSHPAFAYFCRDYDLRQLSIEQEGREPLPKYQTWLIEQIRQLKLRAVFTLKQYNNKGAELLAKELNLTICPLDPYSPDYLENMRFMAAQFARYSHD